MKVSKKSRGKPNSAPKPFKSGLRVNTVKDETINPHTGLPAYTFIEDDSIVDQRACKIVKE